MQTATGSALVTYRAGRGEVELQGKKTFIVSREEAEILAQLARWALTGHSSLSWESPSSRAPEGKAATGACLQLGTP